VRPGFRFGGVLATADCSTKGRLVATVPARSPLPHPHVASTWVAAYTPLHVLFLSRLAHVVGLCYQARHMPPDDTHTALLHHALRSTIDDCFAVGLAPELLALLAEGPTEA
jgi:hypothetical protein